MPVAAPSKACVCDRSLVGLPVRIPETWMSVSCECFVLSGRYLRRADDSSRGVLLTVMRVSAIVKPRQ